MTSFLPVYASVTDNWTRDILGLAVAPKLASVKVLVLGQLSMHLVVVVVVVVVVVFVFVVVVVVAVVLVVVVVYTSTASNLCLTENISDVTEIDVGVDAAVTSRHVDRHHGHGASLADARHRRPVADTFTGGHRDASVATNQRDVQSRNKIRKRISGSVSRPEICGGQHSHHPGQRPGDES